MSIDEPGLVGERVLVAGLLAAQPVVRQLAGRVADCCGWLTDDEAELRGEWLCGRCTLNVEAVAHVTCLRERAERAEAERDRVQAELARGEASDGYHTHRELYEYRMLHNAHAARGWLAAGVPVAKSWRHSGGELCYGGGWFIVVAELPTGQVSNHYREEHWGLFDVPVVDLPPEYDGHSPSDVADRLLAALAAARTEGRTA